MLRAAHRLPPNGFLGLRAAAAAKLWHIARRHYAAADRDEEMVKVRNMGIIAHVDAGKTTTAERFLYLAGSTRTMGDVDTGDTTMDFLEMERERGITIQSAAISFPWGDTRINMIDTPGHVDFQAEVERSVRVLDGAVAILDAVHGVQAQTNTVWKQADRHKVPRLVYMNKMDRDGASFQNAVESLAQRFPTANPLPIHLPIGADSTFRGMVDLVEMQAIDWPTEGDIEGLRKEPMTPEHRLYDQAVAARAEMVESLANVDEEIFETFLEAGAEEVTADDLHAAIRRATHSMAVAPVLCGTSFKKRGIQPLLDAVVKYLPAPHERPDAWAHTVEKPVKKKDVARKPRVVGDKVRVAGDPDGPLVALAFKVVHDAHRGMVIHCRVYSGSLKSGSRVTNVNRMEDERALNLFRIEADHMVPVDEIRVGDIGAIVGLKHTSTGDTLMKAGASSGGKLLQLDGVTLAPPVFSCAVEANSDKEQPQLDEAIQMLLKEDPSVHTHVDKDSGQTLISGMGELHLEIVKDRLLNHYKLPATMGKVQISYRSTLDEAKKLTHHYNVDFGGKKRSAGITLMVEPLERGSGTEVALELPKSALKHLTADEAIGVEDSILEGLNVGFRSGALFGYPITDVRVRVLNCEYGPDSSDGSMKAAATKALIRAIEEDPTILQPVMLTEVTCPVEHMGSVIGDLTGNKKGSIETIENDATGKVIRAHVPLRALLGYSTGLRSLTQGSAAFSMEFAHYGELSPAEATQLVDGIRGGAF